MNIVEYLIYNGANVQHRDFSYKTPYDYLSNGEKEVICNYIIQNKL